MTRRWISGVALGVWWACVLLALLLLAAWLIGRVASDSIASLQVVSWIPVPAIVASLLLVSAAMALVARPRRMAGGVAAAAALLAVAHLAQRWGPPRSCVDALRIVHWNAASPGPDEVAAYQTALEAAPCEVLVISNDWWLFGRPFTHEWVDRDRRVYRAGPFAMVTDLPVEEARLVVANGRRWVGLFRLGASPQGDRPLTLLVVDLPSSIRASRVAVAAELRANLRDLALPDADLVMGDFNMDHGSRALASIFPEHRGAFSIAGEGYAGSYPRRSPLWQPDQMLVAPGLEVCGYRLIDLGIGTHRAQEIRLPRRSVASAP